ncbi:MAG: hypothetical protein E6105_06120 [Finegoldia magna]|nr:hypothetical protein [Finegoldia magna]
MEKRVSDFDDSVWEKFKRSKDISKKRSIGNCKKLKVRNVEEVEKNMFTQAVEEIVELVNTFSKTIGRLALAVLLINLVIITWRMM